jgi:hypothetical protein
MGPDRARVSDWCADHERARTRGHVARARARRGTSSACYDARARAPDGGPLFANPPVCKPISDTRNFGGQSGVIRRFVNAEGRREACGSERSSRSAAPSRRGRAEYQVASNLPTRATFDDERFRAAAYVEEYLPSCPFACGHRARVTSTGEPSRSRRSVSCRRAGTSRDR